MSARQLFLTRQKGLKEALGDPALVGKSFADHRARLLRNGLAVVSFALLEDYIRSRTREAIESIDSTRIRFEQLPEALRKAATVGVVKALRNEVQRRVEEEALPLIREAGESLATLHTGTYRLSWLALGWENSNLSATDVQTILAAFQVHDGWNSVTGLARRFGAGSLDLREVYVSGLRSRNHAAHDANADVPVTDLQDFQTSAVAVAAAFDGLVSRSARLMSVGDHELLSGRQKVRSTDISIRFIDNTSRGFREIEEGATRATKVEADIDVLRPLTLARAQRRGQLVVERTARSFPWLGSQPTCRSSAWRPKNRFVYRLRGP